MTLRILIAATLAGSALLLAACGSNDNNTPETVPALAASTISNDTCSDQEPQGINNVSFTPDTSTVTDVTRLTPDCSNP